MKKPFLLFSIFVLLIACVKKPIVKSQEELQNEIIKVEKNFEKVVSQKGISEGFYIFADSNAVIKRENDTLIKGKENIKNYYSTPIYKTAKVSWQPDFVEVSGDGTMAYTYGKYVWIADNFKTSKGIFHTVWKKQKDGSWKYVWD